MAERFRLVVVDFAVVIGFAVGAAAVAAGDPLASGLAAGFRAEALAAGFLVDVLAADFLVEALAAGFAVLLLTPGGRPRRVVVGLALVAARLVEVVAALRLRVVDAFAFEPAALRVAAAAVFRVAVGFAVVAARRRVEADFALVHRAALRRPRSGAPFTGETV